MLRTISGLRGTIIAATDGEIGSVQDLYFDDLRWTVRYLMVDTGAWLPGRQVLISPMAVGGPSWGEGRLPVRLTKQQVENSPLRRATSPWIASTSSATRNTTDIRTTGPGRTAGARRPTRTGGGRARGSPNPA